MNDQPERLYHFTEAKYALDDLRNRRLKIAEFGDLNDPFELKAVDLSGWAHEWACDQFKTAIAPLYGVLCFSKDSSNILHWSHYAKGHTGICLGFDVSGSREKFGPVDYRADKMPHLANITLNDVAFMSQLLHTKFDAWKYEKEWRVFINLDTPIWNESANRNLYFVDFGPELVLREVILGAENKNTTSEVRTAIQGYSEAESVRVMGAHLSASTFELTLLEESELMVYLIRNQVPEWSHANGTRFHSAEEADRWKRLVPDATGIVRLGDYWCVVKKDRRAQ